MDKSESIKEFSAAFLAAQIKIKGAAKDAINPHYKVAYADLASVMDACKSALNENGISILQTPAEAKLEGYLALNTVLLHKSGEWISGHMEIPLGSRIDPQSFGSAMTYARRYSLGAMVGVCPEDDDAEGAQGRGKQPQGKPKVDPDKAFRVALAKAFKDRGFTTDDQKSTVDGVVEGYQLKSLLDMSREQRHLFVDAVKAGEMDGYKAGSPAEGQA